MRTLDHSSYVSCSYLFLFFIPTLLLSYNYRKCRALLLFLLLLLTFLLRLEALVPLVNGDLVVVVSVEIDQH